MFKFDLGDLWHLTLFSTDLDIWISQKQLEHKIYCRLCEIGWKKFRAKWRSRKWGIWL